jgi:signal transduction histidine kinase
VISGNLELLEPDITQPLSRAGLNDARTAAGRGAKLIRDMLAFSQRTRLEPQICDLNRLVTTTCARSKDILTQSVDLRLTQDPWMVNVDPKVAENALLNLILNAQDAMPGGGKLEIKTENISHSIDDNRSLAIKLAPGRYVRLSVRDDGEGIPEERLQQIFDPFYTTKPVGGGTGLGLSMVFGFMHQSGGTVEVQSEVADGSTFRLYFPAATSNDNNLLTKNP